MGNDNAALGKASLWTSVIGIALPTSLAILVGVFLRDPKDQGLYFGLCVLLGVILEVVALGCGVAARRTPAGKAGLAISSIPLLMLVLGVVSWFFWR
jgi:hypothetical protein